MNTTKKIVIGGGILIVLVILCIAFFRNKTTAVGVFEKPEIVTSTRGVTPDEKRNISPAITETKTTLANAKNSVAVQKAYGVHLSSTQKKFLDTNKFVLLPLEETSLVARRNNFDDMLTSFDTLSGGSSKFFRAPENAKLITPDIVLHAYHVFFDMTLAELEKKELTESLDMFLKKLYGNMKAIRDGAKGNTKERADIVLGQIAVARVLLANKSEARPAYFNSQEEELAYTEKEKTVDTIEHANTLLELQFKNDITSGIYEKVKAELALVYKHDTPTNSPLWGEYANNQKPTDYTQYTPRSHYTKSSTLRAYFRTMMYWGRSSYQFSSDTGKKDALLLAQAFGNGKDGKDILQSWQRIMDVTRFYAGESDDLTYTEWSTYLQGILGGKIYLTDSALSSASKKITENISKLRLPKILSDIVVDDKIGTKTKDDLLLGSLSFRVFGQRFMFDSFILNQLTAGSEKTKTLFPSTPSAVFVPATLGHEGAQGYTREYLKNNTLTPADIVGFEAKQKVLATSLSKIASSEWYTALSSAWLYVLTALRGTYGVGYPAYMQSPHFADKDLNTFLGSYTELKHDTLLYGKQSYAELGGGGPDETILPPVVKGFVEPNMVFWVRFEALLEKTNALWKDLGLFADHSASARFASFREIIAFYRSLAEKESTNTTITEDEYETLRTTTLSFMAQPFESIDPTEDTGKVALVADIHTDALANKILYEATGKPLLMIALVGNEKSPRMVLTPVYHYYEFTGPIATRVTDEVWKDIVYKGTSPVPAEVPWVQSLLVK